MVNRNNNYKKGLFLEIFIRTYLGTC